jgi:xylulokinase
MSLLGLDVGTTGCKASAFSADGEPIASAYEEYDNQRPQPGWAELDAQAVWAQVKRVLAAVAAETGSDPVTALAASSLGEAMVPVTAGREILGPSILNFDVRGEEYLDGLAQALPDDRLYGINGNTLGNHYGVTKLLWLKNHAPDLYEKTDTFLHWSSFVSFMLGADPVADYTLANRTLLFDVDKQDWSDDLLAASGLDRARLPNTAPSGTVIGTISDSVAVELGLPKGVAIVTGAHDQCANGVGCGVLDEGRAMLGMGTFLCIMPVFAQRRPAAAMMARGLNTEHHAAPDRFVSFIYNQGGSLLKWYRDTFARAEHQQAQKNGDDIYPTLIGEMPDGPSPVMVLPHFTTTGPPDFISDSSGIVAGLKLETTRGDILKGILEGAIFYLRECVDALPEAGVTIADIRAAGGGSKSDTWLQLTADILGIPLTRCATVEAGALGAAILAGTATNTFDSLQQGVDTMVRLGETFEPDPESRAAYTERFAAYRDLWPTIRDWNRRLAT